MGKPNFKHPVTQALVLGALLAGSFAPHGLYGQSELKEVIPYRNSATLVTDAGVKEINFTRKAYRGIARRDVVYHSYYRDSIYHTQGAYHGFPLHGAYTWRYPNKNLREYGYYKQGRRSGRWMYWDDRGVLRKVSHWRRGKETGRFAYYSESGALRQSGFMQDGHWDGFVKNYAAGDDAQDETKRFRDGREIGRQEGSWLGLMREQVKSWFRIKI